MPNDSNTQLGFIMAAPNRIKILKAISRRRVTPMQISNNTDILPTNVSRTLKHLECKNLIKCITSGLRKGKLFMLTEEGKAVLDDLIETEDNEF